MVSWLFYLGGFLEPFFHSVRWPAVILGHLTLGVWYLILKDSVALEKYRIWVWLVLFSPLLGFGSIIVTPDLPVVFFWSLSLALALKALSTKSLHFYSLLGVALGLGFCAKYHIVLFVPCLLLYILLEKKWKSIRWTGVLATTLTGLTFCLPVILWNVQNGFASFEFQLKHGLEKSVYNFEWTTSYIVGQILLVFPLMFWAALRARTPANLRWLYYFGWGPLVFFLLTSFRASTEGNWPIVGYPALLALALFHPQTQKWLKYYLFFWGLLFSFVLSAQFIPSVRGVYEKLHEPYLFQEFSRLAQDYRPLYADSYQMASSIWYFTKVPTYKLKEMSRIDFFDTFPEATPRSDRFYLLQKEGNLLPQWFEEQNWKSTVIKKVSEHYILLEFTKR